MTSLTLVPIGGLGNRMRAIASAIKLADEAQCQLRIAWQATRDCNATFDDLFLPIDNPNVSVDKGTFADSPANKTNLWLPKLLRGSKYAYDNSYYRPQQDDNLRNILTQGSAYIACGYSIGEYEPKLLTQVFVPNTLLDSRITETIGQFSPHTIGVHIRRTDNKQSICESPLTAFRERIDQALEAQEADRIFLCTDDQRVKDHFASVYGDRLITRQIKLERSICQAIQDAVVDMWCLSKTAKIVGSYYSSFTDTAAELGNTPLEIVRKHK